MYHVSWENETWQMVLKRGGSRFFYSTATTYSTGIFREYVPGSAKPLDLFVQDQAEEAPLHHKGKVRSTRPNLLAVQLPAVPPTPAGPTGPVVAGPSTQPTPSGTPAVPPTPADPTRKAVPPTSNVATAQPPFSGTAIPPTNVPAGSHVPPTRNAPIGHAVPAAPASVAPADTTWVNTDTGTDTGTEASYIGDKGEEGRDLEKEFPTHPLVKKKLDNPGIRIQIMVRFSLPPSPFTRPSPPLQLPPFLLPPFLCSNTILTLSSHRNSAK